MIRTCLQKLYSERKQTIRGLYGILNLDVALNDDRKCIKQFDIDYY